MSAPLFEVGVIFSNNAELVQPFFFLLRQSCHVPFRVLVVNQGSVDETAERVARELRGTDRVVTHPDNPGCAGGRNRILRLRTPSLPLFLLDSDCLVARAGTCEALLAILKTHALAYARQRGFHFGDLAGRGYSAAMFRPEVFDRLGGFDENCRMFYDDTLHFEALHRAGMPWMTVETAEVLHLWGSTTRADPKWQEVMDRDRIHYEKVRIKDTA